MYNVGKIARENLLDEFQNVVESSNQPQAAIDLWILIRYLSQLPADYLANRVSLPCQQAIVTAARTYLEFSSVDKTFFRCSNTKTKSNFFFRFRIQLSKLFLNLVPDEDLHKPGSIYKLIIRFIRQKHPNLIHIIDDVGKSRRNFFIERFV